ncbi:dnaJ [Symbiodinium natans]|uniref:DnaJ protein n=1 Tax=Symbiodinium natans TaxID=878477 RepID=A0A812JGL2_9DINO|nr:dnaJ [Symbiodinium natans]
MAQQDLYELLGVQKDVPELEIRSSYRRRALQVHPDKGGSEDLFHAVLTAFEVLSCRSTRQIYDTARGRGLSPKDALAAATGRSRSQDLATTKVQASHRALLQLRQLLAALTREARQEALQRIPAEVQQALMTFMQQEADVLPQRPSDSGGSSDLALTNASGDTGGAGGRISRGILRQNTSPPSYKACVFLPNLFLMSVANPSLELVLQRHSVLLRTRELLCSNVDELSSRSFRAAFTKACEEAELDGAEELRALTFCAIVPAYYEASNH